MPNRPPSGSIKVSEFSESDQPSRYQLLKLVDQIKNLTEEHVAIVKQVRSLDESANCAINDVKDALSKQKSISMLNTEKLDVLIEWKVNVSNLLHGSDKGEFGYFQKSNILWKIIVLWPVILGSTAFGALLTIILQRTFK